MSTITLLVAPGKLLGFLMLANTSAMSQAPTITGCTFTGVPTEAALLSKELSAFVQEMESTKLQCAIEKEGTHYLVKVKPSANSVLLLTIKADGVGEWHMEHEGKVSVQGICEMASLNGFRHR